MRDYCCETPPRETTSSVVAISDFCRFARHQIDHSGWPALAATASFPGREWLPIFPLNAPNVADTGILLCTSSPLSARSARPGLQADIVGFAGDPCKTSPPAAGCDS